MKDKTSLNTILIVVILLMIIPLYILTIALYLKKTDTKSTTSQAAELPQTGSEEESVIVEPKKYDVNCDPFAETKDVCLLCDSTRTECYTANKSTFTQTDKLFSITGPDQSCVASLEKEIYQTGNIIWTCRSNAWVPNLDTYSINNQY
ncbi:MAG: hypothetical protein WCJ58_05400 [bacterium]